MHATRPQDSRATRVNLPKAACIAMLLMLAPTLSAQSSPLLGSIVDDLGKPIEGARITVRGVKAHAYSDAAGHFVVASAPNGLIVVLAQAPLAFPAVELLQHRGVDSLAFIVQRIGEREDTTIALRAEREALRLADRYARAAAASRSATAITDREITLRAPQVTTDLFIGIVGFRTSGSGFAGTVISVRDGCSPIVWVNDVEQIRFSVNEVRPSAIKLLLAWNGYSLIPAHLRSVRAAATCGVIQIITK